MPELRPTLPLLPLTNGVVLPGMVLTMALESEESRAAADAASAASGRIVLVPHLEGRYAAIGVVAEILESGELPKGPRALVIRGLERVQVGAAVPGTSEALWVQVEPISDGVITEAARELAKEYRAVLENILITRGARRLATELHEVTEPGEIADLAGYSPDLTLAQKLEVLETLDVEARLRLVLGWAKETLADLNLRERIKSTVEDDLEKTQREFLLRRQLDAIRHELGELSGDDDEEGRKDDPAGYRRRAEQANLPDDVRKAVNREIDRLERTSEQSPEGGWIRTWLDTILELPFGVESEDNLDLADASAILEADHEGLTEVKERILEHLAVRKLQRERGLVSLGRGAGAILVLVGPPGVGKTSLGESVAHALGRKFVRVSLGGVHDEAEIRGHRRTYVGAQPGRLARAMREAGTMNPVLLLDEVDKIGADFRGDPSAALLEVLDPAQNHTFTDHYLEVPLDLSKVLFIATANVLDTIPGPLLDRMEILRLDGYSEEEKIRIGRRHLLPRQIERAALRPDEVEISDAAILRVVADYTREAGVRQLERELARLLRKAATKLAAGELSAPVVVEDDDVRSWLGRPRVFSEVAERTGVPGVATGLAVTGAGGDVLFIEASASEGSEGLTLTGQLGDVMKESAEIALSYVRSHLDELGISPERLRGRHIHVHVPAGAVPKDGPSAGVTMTTALVSLLTGRAVRPVLGMTGEVTLRGKVLPIGGVVQKVLAAHRAGLTEVALPARNGQDLEDLPESVRIAMRFHLVSEVSELLEIALEPADAALDATGAEAA